LLKDMRLLRATAQELARGRLEKTTTKLEKNLLASCEALEKASSIVDLQGNEAVAILAERVSVAALVFGYTSSDDTANEQIVKYDVLAKMQPINLTALLSRVQAYIIYVYNLQSFI
jgi:hypothetical protein